MQTIKNSLLFEKNSTFYTDVPKIFEKMTGIYAYANDSYLEDGECYVVLKNEDKLNHSMASFLFVKSPDVKCDGYILYRHDVTNVNSKSFFHGLGFHFVQ